MRVSLLFMVGLGLAVISFFAAVYDNFSVPLFVIGIPLLLFIGIRQSSERIAEEKEKYPPLPPPSSCAPQNIRPVTLEHPHARMDEGVFIEPDFKFGHLPDEMINWQAQRCFKNRKLESEFYRKI